MFISFLNPQGNFDRNDSRWASHPDFGGQLVYVKNLAAEMADMGHRVDIVTRRIVDKDWPEFSEPFDSYPGYDNLRIVRIDFGPEKFLNKEELWPYICSEYVDHLIELYKKEGRMPDAVTAHYGDGGLAAAYFKNRTGIPYTFTAHSLGAQKMDKLKINRYNIEKYNKTYNFTERLLAERISMNHADKIITSTIQERFSQYPHTAYQEAVVIDNDEKFAIAAPGVSLKIFDKADITGINDDLKAYVDEKMARDIDSKRLSMPALISSSRLDPKKNIVGLLKAYSESDVLQDSANLVIVTRGHDNPLQDYESIPQGKEREVLIELISLVDHFNLRGKVSMFSIDNQNDLADMYRYLAERNSVFCLTALYEPFGLAPLEAMACGLPAVVTKFGGPAESLREGDSDFGLLVDPNDPGEVASAIYSLVKDEKIWQQYSDKGYKRVLDAFTWKRTAEKYLEVIEDITGNGEVQSVFNIKLDKYFLEPQKHPEPPLDLLIDLYLKYHVLCVGETVVDFISTRKTHSLRHAETFTRYLGGNPAYVSVYVSKLSKKAMLLTKLGRGQFGSFLERELQKYGVCTEFIKYSAEDDTSVAFLTQTPTFPDFQSMRSADQKLNIKEIDPEIVSRAEIVHTSLSSLSKEPARSAIRKVLRLAKKAGKKILIDPNYHPQIWNDKEEALEILAQICDGVTFVTASIADARHLFDHNLKEKTLIDLTTHNFHDWGVDTVIVTVEGRYVVVSQKGRKKTVRNLPTIDIVDVSGGGAAFISGFLVGYLEDLSISDSIRLAHEVSAIALKSVGPFPKSIFRNEIMEKIN